MTKSIALTALFFAVSAAHAQSGAFRPTKPVTLIVPYSAGGGTDVVGRLFAKELGELWGKPVLVDNRIGANGVIGTAVVAKAPADGTTLLLAVSSIVINPYVVPKLPYTTKTDFTPITPVAKPVSVLVSSPSLPASDLKSFIELAKARPGKYSIASSEPSTRLSGERIAKAAKIQLVQVPYKGAAQWMADVAGNVVDTGFASLTSALPMMQHKRLKILAIASAERNTTLPDVPTFREVGINDLDSKSWYGLFGPGGLPPNTVAAIYADVMKVLAKQEVKDRIRSLGAEPGGEDPAAFARRFHQELHEYDQLTREAGMQVE
ncbi:tripartite tricarboxylate transporter substrate-binding protein [Cupriavidus necator]